MKVVSISSKVVSSAQEFTDPVICNCHGVKFSTIKMAMRSAGADTAEKISEVTNAGLGCRACTCRIERILKGFPPQCGPCKFCPACGVISLRCKCA